MYARTAAVLGVLTVALLVSAPAAQAAFPGANGPIVSAFINWDSEDVGILRDHTDLTPDSVLDYDPAVSPDGSRIAFTSARGGDEDVYVMDRDGTRQLRLTDSPGNDFAPAFAPDGATIAFTSDRDGNLELYTVNIDGSDETRLTTTSASAEQDPVFSPDGTQLAYSSDAAGNREIYLARPDASAAVRLTDHPADDSQPNFAPDGARIAFTSTRDSDTPQIYVMRADGSQPTNLSASSRARRDSSPSFSPDGTKIAVKHDYISSPCPPDDWCGTGGALSGGISVINSDGTPGRTIIDDSGSVFNPDWSVATPTPTATPSPTSGSRSTRRHDAAARA